MEERLRTNLNAVEDPDSELRATIERHGGDLTAMAERNQRRIRRSQPGNARALCLVGAVSGPLRPAGYGAFLFAASAKNLVP